MPQNAIFLDRDGVINPYVYHPEFGTMDSPCSPDEFMLAPGAGEAVAEFNRLGLLVVGVSNQPGIAKGKFTPAVLQQVNAKMHAVLRNAVASRMPCTTACTIPMRPCQPTVCAASVVNRVPGCCWSRPGVEYRPAELLHDR